jgi:hypothetical protein
LWKPNLMRKITNGKKTEICSYSEVNVLNQLLPGPKL